MKIQSFLGVFAVLSSGHVATGDDSKIVGGFTANLKNMPFATSLQYQGAHFCGGALVTLSNVLSGCHCLTLIEKGTKHEDVRFRATEHLTAVVGTENIYQTSEYHQQRKITEIKIHPKCSFVEVMIYDFAVGYLNSPFEGSVKVEPFKVFSFSKGEYDRKTKDLVNSKKSYCYVAGWGSVEPTAQKANPFIKAARMKLIPDRECQRRLGLENAKFLFHNLERSAMMCSLPYGYRKNESDCLGDSGGPFFCGPTVYGIVSFGFECGNWDSPNVYARVSHAVDWLVSLNLFPQTSSKKNHRSSRSNKEPRSPICSYLIYASIYFNLTYLRREMRVDLILIWMIGSVTTSAFSKSNRTKHRFSNGRLQNHSSDNKIAGGWFVKTMTNYPYMVSIMLYLEPICGASLLTTSFVVTACHCLADLPEDKAGPAEPRNYLKVTAYDFLAGTVNIKMCDRFFQSRKAKSIHFHPKCANITSLVYDMGLAKMREPFVETPHVQPLKMYTWDREIFLEKMVQLFSTANNPTCTVAGWGDPRRGYYKTSISSDRLKATRMYVLSNEQCQEVYSEMFPELFEGFDFSKYDQICTVSKNLDSSDCSGDSGGPYVCSGYIIGVVSYGVLCGTEDPSVYQTVAVLIDWCKKEFVGEIDMSDPASAKNKYGDGARQSTQRYPPSSSSNQKTNSRNVLPIMIIALIMRYFV